MFIGVGICLPGLGFGGFSPASVFAGSAAGMWLDPSDITTGFQDSAGTIPQTASGQQTGKRLDKSGRGNHVLQATAAARPEYDVISGISSDFFDGSDDIYSATFSAGTLVAGMTGMFAVKRTGNMICSFLTAGAGPTIIGAIATDVNPATAAVGAGPFAYTVNGVSVGSNLTQTQLQTAVPTGQWSVIEIAGLDLSALTALRFGFFNATYPALGDYGGVLFYPTASAGVTANLRKWLGAKVGLSL